VQALLAPGKPIAWIVWRRTITPLRDLTRHVTPASG